MEDLVSVTYARNNFKTLIDAVAQKGKTFILLKKSRPQAAIIPYEEVLNKKKKWQSQFEGLRKDTQIYFDKWLAKKGKGKKNLTEEKLYQFLDEKD